MFHRNPLQKDKKYSDLEFRNWDFIKNVKLILLKTYNQ